MKRTYFVVAEYETKATAHGSWERIESKDAHEWMEYETEEEARAAFEAHDLALDWQWFKRMEWRGGHPGFSRGMGLELELVKWVEVWDGEQECDYLELAAYTADDAAAAAEEE